MSTISTMSTMSTEVVEDQQVDMENEQAISVDVIKTDIEVVDDEETEMDENERAMELLKKSSNFLKIKTGSCKNLRILFETIKEILLDTPIIFTPEGIKISSMDKMKHAFVQVHLKSEPFEEYFCPIPINLGVDLVMFHKYINKIRDDNVFTLYLSKDNPDMLGMMIEDSKRGLVKKKFLSLMEPDEDDITEVPENLEFDSDITLVSSDFNDICKEMSNFSDTLEITSVNEQLIFKIDADQGQQSIVLTESEDTIIKSSKDAIVRGKYSLKYLNYFTKATNLSHQMTMSIKNDDPMVLTYPVGDLGEIKFILSQKSK